MKNKSEMKHKQESRRQHDSDYREPMSNNEFVRREQDKMKSMMGKRPQMPAEMERFDAYMSNDGEKAQEACRRLTAGIDKDAFPVK